MNLFSHDYGLEPNSQKIMTRKIFIGLREKVVVIFELIRIWKGLYSKQNLIRAMIKYFYLTDNISFEKDKRVMSKTSAVRLIGKAVQRQHSISI